MESKKLEKDNKEHDDGSKEALPHPPTKEEKPSATKKRENIVAEARKLVSALLEAIEEDRKATNYDSGQAFSKISLKAFATSDSISVEKFKQSGGIKAIVTALKKHCTSNAVVENGCQALTALTLHEKSTLDELVKAGAIETIISCLHTQADRNAENACVSCLKTLRNLTQTAENRTQIWKASGIEAVVKAMTTNMEKTRLLSHASLVLSNLAFGNAEIKEAVGVLGGIAGIAGAMKEHKDCQVLQARGSLALRNLCFQSETNQRIAGECEAAATLLDAIQFYMEDREVAHQSCIALVNLSNSSEENRARIVSAKGGAVLTKLMQTYGESATVHEDCISIIRNIAVDSRDAQLEIGLHGGVACICRAITKFTSSEKIADKACCALRYLCFLAENRAKVGECGGIEAIVEGLKMNKSSASSVENALLALGNATFECEQNKNRVGKCGGIGEIIAAAEQHRMNASIQEHGCRVLRNLSDGCELNQRLEAEGGAIKTGVFALVGFPQNASVQEQACAMLLNIALSGCYVEAMQESDVDRLAEKAIGMHPKHRGVQLQAGSLLDRLNGYDVGGVAEGRTGLNDDEVGNGTVVKGLRGLLTSVGTRQRTRSGRSLFGRGGQQ